MNWYLEQIESGLGRSPFALYPTPGLNLLYNLGFTTTATSVVGTPGIPLNLAVASAAGMLPGLNITVDTGAQAEVVKILSVNPGVPSFQAVFTKTHALGCVISVPGGPGSRGIITTQGRSFCVQGTRFWELLSPQIAPNCVVRGSVVSDGLPVSMAAGGHQILLVSAGKAYVYDLVANTLTAVDPSAGANLPIAMVAFADSFFFALVENVAPVPWQINASLSFDATSWNALDETQLSVMSANPNAIFVNQRYLWVFSPTGIQPYVDTGDFPFPYDPISGAYIENGLAAPFSIVKLDNSIFWLGSDERGNGMVWRANGFVPQRVSNHAIEFALQSYSTIADAFAYSYQDQGHSFYVLHFPTADKTWVYDVAVGQWHERGFWNSQAGKFNRHRAAYHTFNFGMHLVADYATGSVYQQSINIYSDFGNPIRRLRRAPHISKEQDWTFHQRLQVDVEVGLGQVSQDSGPATLFYIADSTGQVWSVGITDYGMLTTAKSKLDASPLNLSDEVGLSSWQVQISPVGDPFLAPIPYQSEYQAGIPMISQSGSMLWALNVRQISSTLAQLTTQPQGFLGRGPLMTLKWSNDGAKTFSNGQSRDCGSIGQYMKRVIWNRLGRARDRVYEISVSDPIPWRIIDAYLDAGGYEPSERLNKDLAKRA